MEKAINIAVLVFMLLVLAISVFAAAEKEDKGFHSVPPELAGLDWKRTPVAVLNNPVKDEPLIWLGLVKNVFVSQKDGKTEIEWFCEHLSILKAGPTAILVRPIKARKGEGYFSLSIVLDGRTNERALKFKEEHTSSPHYILAGGKFDGVVEREGKQVPFLYTLRFGMGPNLALIEGTR